MPETFDPYLEWLGIKPRERPIDHYRLLGVPHLEADLERIREAADERMARVRSFQTGPRGKLTQPLLNELAVAKRCLLDPDSKAKYDSALRERLTAIADAMRAPAAAPPAGPAPPPVANPPLPQPPVPPPAPAPAAAPPPTAGDFPSAAQRPAIAATAPSHATDDDRPEPLFTRAWFPVLVVGGVVAVAASVWAVGRFWSGRETAEKPPQQARALAVVQPARMPIETTGSAEQDVVVVQDENGEVVFPVSAARIHGTQLRLETRGGESVIGRWTSVDEWVAWRFKVVVPSVFRVHLTYATADDADGGSCVLVVDGEPEKVCRLRRSGGPDQFVTDDYFVAVTKTGEHTLGLRVQSKPGQELMTLKAIRFIPRAAGRLR